MKGIVRILFLITFAYVVGWAVFAVLYYVIPPLVAIMVNLTIAVVVWVLICTTYGLAKLFKKGI